MTFPDGLRAIAALMVILPHAVGLFAYWSSPSWTTRILIAATDFGRLGVQIFFVLSGFVIAHTLPRDHLTPGFFANFMLRRSVRLDPPYWAAIALSYAFLASRRLLTHDLVVFPSRAALLANLLYVQDLLGFDNINPVFWTLCIEIQFYLVFCLLLGLIKLVAASPGVSRLIQPIGIVTLSFLVSLIWPAGLVSATWPLTGLFLPHWYGFLLGVIVRWSSNGTHPRWTGVTAVSLVALVGLIRPQNESLVVAGTAASLLVAADRGGLYHWLAHKPVQLVGRLSYSIYLVHVPVVGVVLGLQTRIAPRREVTSYVLLGLVYLGSLALALGLHHVIEAPAIRLSGRLKRPARSLPDPSGVISDRAVRALRPAEDQP